MALHPVLQIVHVSDLHFKDIKSKDVKILAEEWTILTRLVRRAIIKHGLCGWYEGTQGHYPQAPDAFLHYLQNVLIPTSSPAWFGSTDRPPTWLLDTGDLTTFGDNDAIKLGKEWLAKWRAQLAANESRELIGNHDAWAGCQPIFALLGKINPTAAQNALLQLSGWNRNEWMTKPLIANLPGTKSRIELYAIDSVCWDPKRNFLALGYIDAEAFKRFRDHLKSQEDESAVANFRILALHHPIVFPWKSSETLKGGVIPVMRMLQEDRVVEDINNDTCDPDLGPLAHLVLSGHTHAAHPSKEMPDDVTNIKQGMLGDFQFQLVGGALLLNETVTKSSAVGILLDTFTSLVSRSRFSNNSTDRALRAEILRFYYDPTRPDELQMYRIPVYSVNGSVYRQGKASRTAMYLRAPRPITA